MHVPTRLTLAVLGLIAAVNLARGGLHVFLPDSGAEVIAGLDLSQGGAVIVFLLASVGIGQIGAGLIEIAVLIWARKWAVALLTLEFLKSLAALWLMTVYKPLPVTVPGERFAAIIAILLGAALLLQGLLACGRTRGSSSA